MLHRYFPSQHIGVVKGQAREIAVGVARLYELMSRIYFYSNETLPIIYTAVRFVNEAERAGTSPELATAYASMSILAGFMQLHNLADAYVMRGIDVAKKVNQPSNRVTVNVVTGVYQITVGKWEEVRTKALEAKVICEQLGDYRQWGDSTVLLAESALIAGDIQFALNIQKILLEDARRRRNPLQQIWSLFGIAANSIRLGEEADSIPMLEEALQILAELPNLASSINTNAQLALAHHRLGQREKSLAYAGRVLDLAANLSPTVYSLDVGFSAVAEVYFELWENALRNPDHGAGSDQLKLSAEKAIKLLTAFKRVFPIGQPFLAYYQGWHEWLIGKPDAAMRSWNKGLAAAQRFNLPYEEGLLRTKLGLYVKDDDERKAHFERAVQIFEKMGAVRELQFVRAQTQKRFNS